MRRELTALGVFAGTAGMLVGTAVAGPNGSDRGTMCVENTQLRAANEVPASTSDAKGHAQVKVRNNGTIEYKIFILNKGTQAERETFTAAHIHEAPPGEAGPVRVTLFSGQQLSSRHIRQRGAVQAPEGFSAADICANPEDYYVNAHSTENRPGAVRGQLG